MVTARAWTQPRGHADIAPSRYDRIEGDGYLTVDAPWLVPALLRSVPEISGRILEPAAGRGHISLELRRAGFDVVSCDIRSYLDPLVDGIGIGDIRELGVARWIRLGCHQSPLSRSHELTAHLTRPRRPRSLLPRTPGAGRVVVPKARRRPRA